MKKTITLVATILCLCACASSPKQMTIKGTIHDYDGSELMFLDAQSGSFELPVDKNGKFSYSFNSDEKHLVMLIYSRTMFSILSENGATSTLDIDLAKDPQVKFGGDYVEENIFLNAIDELYALSAFTDEEAEDAWIPSSFPEYETAIDKKIDELKNLLGKCHDKEFANKYINLDAQSINLKNSYIVLLDPVDSDPHYNSYMRRIDRNSLTDAQNGQIRHYFSWLSKKNNISEEGFALNYLKFIQKEISNQEVKNYLSTQEMNDAFMMPEIVNKELYTLYQKICNDTESKKEIGEKYNQLVSLQKGNPAPDFEMKTIDGTVVKLSDLRGKVVYVDFWASWCVFCCEEIPYLKEVYKKYENNKKLEIISVSFDNDLDAWKSAMDEYDQPWKQYVANGELNRIISDKYMISGIPHFLMIDAKGNLISAAAPRPSDEELITMINNII